MTSYSAEISEAWNDADEETCPECYGTGLDRDEIYECPVCYGEGVIVYFDYEAHPGDVVISAGQGVLTSSRT